MGQPSENLVIQMPSSALLTSSDSVSAAAAPLKTNDSNKTDSEDEAFLQASTQAFCENASLRVLPNLLAKTHAGKARYSFIKTGVLSR